MKLRYALAALLTAIFMFAFAVWHECLRAAFGLGATAMVLLVVSCIVPWPGDQEAPKEEVDEKEEEPEGLQ